MEAVELLVKVYPAQGSAKAALHALEKRAGEKTLRLFSLAALEKDAAGIAQIHESQDVQPGYGALWGAIVGGLIGLLEGPVGVVIGAAAGAATGGLAARKLDIGFSHEFLEQLKTALQPDSSLLLVLVEQSWAEKTVQELEKSPGKLLRHVVKAGLVEQLKEL